MRIAVLGYYGFGNWGDEVILDNVREFLSPHQVVPIPLGLAHSADTVSRLNAFDFIILGGGGLYKNEPPSPFGEFDRWGDRLTAPIGILGLGVSRLSPQFVAATHKLVDQAQFFIVRDQESQRLIDHPKVQVAPDLTFYRPLAPGRQRINNGEIYSGVNLRPAQPGAERWVEAVGKLDGLKSAMPFSLHPTLGDREALLALDPDCPDYFSAEFFNKIDVLIGTAFHSIVFAIQTGTPVIAINYDPKVERLMQELSLTRFLLNWDEWGRLGDCYQALLECRSAVRELMLSYTASARRQLEQALRHPRQLVEQFSKPAPPTAGRPSPKVTIILQAMETSDKEVRRSLSSCLQQSYRHIELIVTVNQRQRAQFAKLLKQLGCPNSVQLLALDQNAADWLPASLEAATGDYVTWLTAGAWFAEDAMALMVAALEENQSTPAVQSDYYLSNEGVIERKVALDRPFAPGKAGILGPALLVRHREAARLWPRIEDGRMRLVGGNQPVLYLSNPLFFKPSTASESNLYRGLMAYGRGNLSEGERLLARVGEADHAGAPGQQRYDLVELIANTARNASVTPTPEAFVELVFGKLPPASDLHRLKRPVLAYIAMRRFFDQHHNTPPGQLLRMVLRAILLDISWLRNRGVWAILARSLFK